MIVFFVEPTSTNPDRLDLSPGPVACISIVRAAG
jgi:hypothetical protein